MGKAGQHTITGIKAQADITFLYLLQASKKWDFSEVLIEGDKWEDFTLVFSDHNEDFEVRWRKKPTSYGDLKTIIEKELKKKLKKRDLLKIVVKQVDARLRQDLQYLSHYGAWLESLGPDFFESDTIVHKLRQKSWRDDQIRFLLRTEVVELQSDEFVRDRMAEHFALEDSFYLSANAQQNLVGQCFRNIFEVGKKGGTITRREFTNALEQFRLQIAKMSESFCPEIPIRGKVENLTPFLRSAQQFKKLNDPKYLSPISSTPRLIFYISDNLEKNAFHVKTFDFFIKKILMRRSYVSLAMRLLQRKWESKKAQPRYLLRFVKTNYHRLFHQLNQYDALRIVLDIAKKHTSGEYDTAILSLMKSEVLAPPFARKGSRFMRATKGRPDHDLLAGLVEILYWRSADKREFLDFVFEYFDLTGDDYHLLIGTHPKIYSLVKHYILCDFDGNFGYILKRICSQFDLVYGGRYDGNENTASGLSQAGSRYTITDKGIVRLLFTPIFESMYAQEPDKAWTLFKRKVLNKAPKQPNKNNPAFLKRALIPVLLTRMQHTSLTRTEKRECLQYLKNILAIKKGVPETSEILFVQLRKQDLRRIGFANVLILVRIDSVKYRRKAHPAGYPTNLFVLATLVELIKAGSQLARRYLLALVAKPDFIRRDEQYHSFDMLSSAGIPESDPDFTFHLLLKLDLPAYVKTGRPSRVWDLTKVLVQLISKDWSEKQTRGKQILTSLLAERTPNSQVLECVGGVIRDLGKVNPVQTLPLIRRDIADKDRFREQTSANPFARQAVCSLGAELARTGHYNEAKTIVNLCIDDPDPETHNRDDQFNYHLKVKQGGDDVLEVTTVRGLVPWILQELAAADDPELVKYALEKTEVLLDLAGRLAQTLGYTEPDYYVRLQAFVPLSMLVQQGPRELLGRLDPELRNKPKDVAFALIDATEKDIHICNVRPIAITTRLAHVFCFLTNLNTTEAKRVVDFFQQQEEAEAYRLFIYFAVFREREHQAIPFDPTYFKAKLKQLCRTRNVFRQRIAWDFWQATCKPGETSKQDFERIEEYWKLLFEQYDREVFDDLYYTLETTLTWPAKYHSHKELLKTAIVKETDYAKTAKERPHFWGLSSKVFDILINHDTADFLDVFHFLLERIDENTYCYRIKEWTAMYRSIQAAPAGSQEVFDKIQNRLRDLYPEEFQS